MRSDPGRPGLLLIPSEKSDVVFRRAFWQWVGLLADGDHEGAVAAVRWPENNQMTPDQLRERIATFFNDEEVMVPIIPNERLVGVIDEKMEIEWSDDPDDDYEGWAMALIPVSPEPQNAQNDDVSLMGIAVSFFIVAEGDRQALEFEVFHA